MIDQENSNGLENQVSNSNSNNTQEEIYVESVQRDVNETPIRGPIDSMGEAPMVPKKHHKKGKKGFVKLVACAAAFGVIASFAFQGANYLSTSRSNTSIQDTEPSDNENNTIQTSVSGDTYSGVSLIVENVMPAIVAITSTVEELSYDFWGRPLVQEASGAGSGIIIGENNNEILISTNNHVISDAKTIVIQFSDDTTAEGIVKGADATRDLAVVAVSKSELSSDTISKIKIASLGSSEELKEGELVIAIGNALGYGQSTTVGYVSALNREIDVDENTTLELIQTDAAINPGNSGGALLNAKGEVIGINSVKYVETDVEGIGYAIPISEAIPIVEDLMNRLELSDKEQGTIAITTEDVTEDYADMLGLPVGVYINQVESGSEADRAGLKVTDVITGVNGRTISTKEELESYLSYSKKGTTVTLTVMVREQGKYVEKSIDVVLEAK